MIHELLVALDASARAEGVFRAAIELAEPLGASMHLLRVISVPPEFPPAGHVSHADALPGYLAKEAREQLGAFAARASPLRVDSSIVESTQPWRVIIDVADRIHADLIVVGSHGYHGLDYLLGTNAGKVANMARRNVLVVHAPPAGAPAGTYRSTG